MKGRVFTAENAALDKSQPVGYNMPQQKALMGTRRGFPSLREPVAGANRREAPRVYWPRSRRPEPYSSRAGRVAPLQVVALLEAGSAHRVTVRGIRVVPRSVDLRP